MVFAVRIRRPPAATRTAPLLRATTRSGSTLRLANALYRAGDAAGSGAAILALRDSQPSSIAADRLAGHLAMDLDHWDQAIGHFERVRRRIGDRDVVVLRELARAWAAKGDRSEEHTSELQSLMRISYA